MLLAPLLAALFALYARGIAHDLSECRLQQSAKDDCLVEAARRALGANVDIETGKALLKGCLSKNNCKATGVEDKITACLANELGFDPYARIKQCMKKAGHPIEERPAAGNIATALPMMAKHVKQQCTGGDARGAFRCIKAELGIDLDAVDPLKVVFDVCEAKPACNAKLSAGCESLLRERSKARSAADCACHRQLVAQVGEQKMAAIEKKCLPRRLHAHFGHTVCEAVDNASLRMETMTCPDGS